MIQSPQAQYSDDSATIEEVMVLLGLSSEALLMALGMYEVVSTTGELFLRTERALHHGAFLITSNEALSYGRSLWKRVQQQLDFRDIQQNLETLGLCSGDPRELMPRYAGLVSKKLRIAPDTAMSHLLVALLIKSSSSDS